MKTVPTTFKEFGDEVMSNFDHSIDNKIAEHIKGKELWADYPGWNFFGKVWWENNQWHCEVRRHMQHVKTISCDTLQDIMNEACSEYGVE